MSGEGIKNRGTQLAVVVVLLLLVGAYFGYRQWTKQPTQPNVDVGRTVAEDFLAKVRNGKAGEAWDSSTAEFKSLEGRESFVRKARSTALLKAPLEFYSVQQVTVQDEPRTEYLFQSTDAKMVRLLIGNERGDWKVDHLTL